jgi:hypothetical protein
MSKPARQASARLEARQRDWDAMSTDAKRGTRRPGSRNAHKSFPHGRKRKGK